MLYSAISTDDSQRRAAFPDGKYFAMEVLHALFTNGKPSAFASSTAEKTMSATSARDPVERESQMSMAPLDTTARLLLAKLVSSQLSLRDAMETHMATDTDTSTEQMEMNFM